MALRSGRVGIHPSQVDPITGMLLNGPTPGSMSFEDLTDAQISNPEAGQTLIYNGTGWENETPSVTPTTLSALQDVQITDPEDGDYLTYDSTSEKWVNSGSAPGPTYTDLTVIIYGAVEDTISFTDAAGNLHTEVFASSQSSKEVTFKINPTGSTSITFTSAIAKDPNNLSNDYTKTVSVTSATTEIKVMPDVTKLLYWYGYNDGLEWCTSENGWSNYGSASGCKEDTFATNHVPISRKSDGYYYILGSKNAITGTPNTTKMVTIFQCSNASYKTYCNPCGGKTTKVVSGGTTNPPYTETQTTNLEKSESIFTANTSYPIIGGTSSVNWTYNLYAAWIE